MKLDDFRLMRRGIPLFELEKKDSVLLNPVKIRSGRKKRALLMLHGFTSTPAVFRVMIPLLSFYDAIFCPTLPGHASSMNEFGKVSAKNWLAEVEKEGQMLSKEFKQVDVVGFSLGGLLASHLSYMIELNHLYLLAPAFDLYSSPSRLIFLAKLFSWLGFKSLRCRSGDLHTHEHFEIAYRTMSLNTVIELLKLIQDTPLPNSNCSTDLFLGQYDQVVSSKRVEERFRSQRNVQIHWLSHSAHIIPLDGDIATIIDCMKEKNTTQKKLK